MQMILGFLIAVAWLVSLFFACMFGFYVCSSDVKSHLQGELPIDEYWRKRGMREEHVDRS